MRWLHWKESKQKKHLKPRLSLFCSQLWKTEAETKRGERKDKSGMSLPEQKKFDINAKGCNIKELPCGQRRKSKETVDSQTKARQPNWQIGQATGSKDKKGITRKKCLNKINKNKNRAEMAPKCENPHHNLPWGHRSMLLWIESYQGVRGINRMWWLSRPVNASLLPRVGPPPAPHQPLRCRRASIILVRRPISPFEHLWGTVHSVLLIQSADWPRGGAPKVPATLLSGLNFTASDSATKSSSFVLPP